MKMRVSPSPRLRVLLTALAGFPLCTSLPATDFKLGQIDASLDVQASVGGTYRLKSADRDLIGLASGGNQYSVNADDGNLNYSKGWVSTPVALTADLDLRSGDYGGFFRINAFYDYINEDRDRERTALHPEAQDRVGKRLDMLDAFLWTRQDIADMPVNFRIGRQVLNWGESTFIQNGVSVINPVDVSKLRLPGAELREAYLPVWMASTSVGITDNITLEAFYQFKWKEVIIDPPGTYFSTNDFAGRGGEHVYLGFGQLGDDQMRGAIPRGEDNRPKNSGQFGLATRIYAPALNQTEFGFYFIQYHSRVPVISARTPSQAIDPLFVQQTASSLAQNSLVPAMLANNIPPETIGAVLPQLLGAALTNVPAGSLPDTLAPFAPFYPGAQEIAAGAGQLGFFNSAATGNYLIEYPENIKLLGASFNTDLGNTGISLQGELTYRWDQPVQIDDVELLFAAMSAVNPQFGLLNQMGNYAGQLDTYVRGWQKEDVWQFQSTGTKVFGPTLGASQWIVLLEAGFTYLPGLPDKDELRFEGPGTFTGGNPVATMAGVQPETAPARGFADRFSWGYRFVTRLDYQNVFMSVNLSPILQFAHDLGGTTPQPIGNFVRNRKTASIGLEATYQNQWVFNITYTNYYGAKDYNLIHDRDFVSTSLKYSF